LATSNSKTVHARFAELLRLANHPRDGRPWLDAFPKFRGSTLLGKPYTARAADSLRSEVRRLLTVLTAADRPASTVHSAPTLETLGGRWPAADAVVEEVRFRLSQFVRRGAPTFSTHWRIGIPERGIAYLDTVERLARNVRTRGGVGLVLCPHCDQFAFITDARLTHCGSLQCRAVAIAASKRQSSLNAKVARIKRAVRKSSDARHALDLAFPEWRDAIDGRPSASRAMTKCLRILSIEEKLAK
jgi:hypothetical protein